MHLSSDARRRETMRLIQTYVRRLPISRASERALRNAQTRGASLPEVLERLARFDPTVAIRMLYEGNHALHFANSGALTLGSLLTHVGADQVVSGILEDHDHIAMRPNVVDVEDLWLHSIQVAIAAKYFAQHATNIQVGGEEAYLAGLLHDTGRFVMLASAPDRYHAISTQEWTNGADLVALEMDVCGFDHATLGWLACRAWGFPDSIAMVIRDHHASDRAAPASLAGARTKGLTQVVSVADEISFALMATGLENAEQHGASHAQNGRILHLAAEAGIPVAEIERVIPLILGRGGAKAAEFFEIS